MLLRVCVEGKGQVWVLGVGDNGDSLNLEIVHTNCWNLAKAYTQCCYICVLFLCYGPRVRASI